MLPAELMAHFVCYVIDVEGVAYRTTGTRNTAGLIGGAGYTQVGHSAATGTEYVSDVVIG